MTPDSRKTATIVTRSEREELLEAMFVDAPELTFTPRGDPDPRLVQLARLLGRQMARQHFAAEQARRGSDNA